MLGRNVTKAVALTAALLASALVVPVQVAAARTDQIPFYCLTALLIVTPDLPPVSKRALLTEAERIWRHEGVELQWPAAESSRDNAPLRVLVIDRREALAGRSNERWRVGELVPQANQRALAIASIAGAERVLAEANGRPNLLLDSRELAEYRLGVVLGRAVAHEIGHFLLDTATHADRGLMRAAIEAREFADPGATSFALDDTAGAWLRHRLQDRHAAAPTLPASGFSYARPTSSPY